MIPLKPKFQKSTSEKTFHGVAPQVTGISINHVTDYVKYLNALEAQNVRAQNFQAQGGPYCPIPAPLQPLKQEQSEDRFVIASTDCHPANIDVKRI